MARPLNQSTKEIEDIVFCIKFRYSCNSVTDNDLSDIYQKLETVIKSTHTEVADACISILAKQLRLDRQNEIRKHPELLKAIVRHFNHSAEMLDREECREAATCNMLNILSILTQIIHNVPNYEMSLNRQFVQNLFMINTNLLENSTRRKDILRVMSVIFCELVKRLTLLKELGLVPRFKQILLESFRLIEDANTFMRMQKCLTRVGLLMPLAMKEIVRYRIPEIYSRFQLTKTVLSDLKAKISEVDSIIVDPNIDPSVKLSQT